MYLANLLQKEQYFILACSKKWFCGGLSVFECFYFETRGVLLPVRPTSFDLENVIIKHFQSDDKVLLYQ